jgi:endoglucanase
MQEDFLKVQGRDIVGQQGRRVRLRGFCLGGWMHMENFMGGYPGHEAGMRAAIANVLGERKAKFFFERYAHYFFNEDDVRFIRSLGCNLIRVALNYRQFESDEAPFEYQEEGFTQLDKLIGWASAHELYVILDLHAVQGWQNAGWHSDNHIGAALLWGQKVFEDRAVGLWEALARRYRDEAYVAGYNVVNEPNTDQIHWLNRYYRRVTEAIRAVDADHILFFEGNRDSQQFDGLDHPFDDNAVYSSHLYIPPGLDDGNYPGEFDGIYYDRDQIRKDYQGRRAFSQRHDVPHWLGEFGTIIANPALEESRMRVMADWIGVVEEQQDHWTIWNYKDIGLMGAVYIHPESEWMRRTKPVRDIKSKLRCDHWIERKWTELDGLIEKLADHVSGVVQGHPGIWDDLVDAIQWKLCDGLLSQRLLPAFAEQFRGLTETEIERLMQSFALENCLRREGLLKIIGEAIRGTGEDD